MADKKLDLIYVEFLVLKNRIVFLQFSFVKTFMTLILKLKST